MLRRSALAIAAGLSLWLAQPGHDLWPLAFVGVAALALATLRLDRLRDGFLIGLLAGVACFVPTLQWSGIYVGPTPWLALSVLQAAYLGLLGVFLAAVQRRAGDVRAGSVRVWLGAAGWVACEALRGSTPFGGFPWARLAFSQTDGPLVHLASIAGAPGVTFAVALVGGALALTIDRVRARPAQWARAALPVAAASGLVLISVPWPTPTDGRPLTVAGIQGNVPQAGLEFNAERRAVLDNHAGLTRRVAADVRAGRTPQPDVVLWPENSSDIDPTRNEDARQVITDAVRDIKAPTIVGAVLKEPSPRISNSSLLYDQSGAIADRYTKQHPVPFAEYIPYRSFFRQFSDQVDLVVNDFAPGKEVGLFQIPTRRGTVAMAPVICFEVAYDDLTREPVNRGAQILLVQTNNATFGYSDESVQQLAISRLRAIEHGRSVAHVSTVGVSALITPDGQLHQRTGLFTQAAMVGDLPLRTDRTLADRWGRFPELAACLLAVVGLLQAVRHRRAAKVPTRTVGSEPRQADSDREHDEQS